MKLHAAGIEAYGEALTKRAHAILEPRLDRRLAQHRAARILPRVVRSSLAWMLICLSLQRRLSRLV
ncbi:hypothetical protein KBB96_14625 [Luteolibacter ambystomatis]|uniref:Uncharacterized protein n=1 Tax=Luteolibacter ambystomatis TaxID=2824561 RepID=A0A975G689_9BACT|nr:hypothetical protein [Luteolibacter ambystomatis]QUE50097.1 hypothetical protein KBB96_14625 [Luteolibacter ambystomatis]